MDDQAYAPGDSTKKTVDKDVNYGRYKKVYDKMNREEIQYDVNPYHGLDEARGRPAGAATLAKRAAAAAKPRNDDDDWYLIHKENKTLSSGYSPRSGTGREIDMKAGWANSPFHFSDTHMAAKGRDLDNLVKKGVIDNTTSESVVVMSDYKLDRRGRKYKAHRHTMGRSVKAMDVAKAMRKGSQPEMSESINPYEDILAENEFLKIAKRHLQDSKRTDIYPAQREYAKEMHRRALEASKIPNQHKAVRHYMGMDDTNEDVQIDEISKGKIVDYIANAAKDVGYHANLTGFVAGQKKPKGFNPTEDSPTEVKRHKGIQRALRKLTGVRPVVKEGLMEANKEGYDQVANWTDNGTTHKRWDKNLHHVGAPADRHLSSIQMWKEKGEDPVYHALHAVVKGYWTNHSTKESPARITHQSKHGSYEDAHAALQKHEKEKYGSRNEDVEQVDEISKKTVGQYLNKTIDPVYGMVKTAKNKEELLKRLKGVARAHQRITGKAPMSEEENKKDFKQGDRVRHEDGTLGTVTKGPDENGIVHWKHSGTNYRFSHVDALKPAGDEKYRWRRQTSESIEQVDEISKATATSYVRKKLSQIAKRPGDANMKDVENLGRAYKRMGVSDKAMKEEIEDVSESSVQKVVTNPDGTRTVVVKTDTGKVVSHTFKKASSINKLLKRRYNIQSSIPEK